MKEFERLRKGETDHLCSPLGHIHTFIGDSVRRNPLSASVLVGEIFFKAHDGRRDAEAIWVEEKAVTIDN